MAAIATRTIVTPNLGKTAVTATVAGKAVCDTSNTWKAMGADGYAASTEQALRVARQLAYI
jgi:hypothetical protein